MNIVFLGVFGLIVLSLGLYTRHGGFKAFYLGGGIPVLMPVAVRNMLIPMGITLIVWEVTASDLVPLEETRLILLVRVIGPMLIISMIVGVWNPRWLRPRWLVYLEDTYGSVMWRLLDEARKNIPAWSRRVRTQQGLEEWAEETYLRLGYPPRQAKSKEKQRNMRVRSRS